MVLRSIVLFASFLTIARAADPFSTTISVTTLWNGTDVVDLDKDYFNVTFGLSENDELEECPRKNN